jgi:hypothetical protein
MWRCFESFIFCLLFELSKLYYGVAIFVSNFGYDFLWSVRSENYESDPAQEDEAWLGKKK